MSRRGPGLGKTMSSGSHRRHSSSSHPVPSSSTSTGVARESLASTRKTFYESLHPGSNRSSSASPPNEPRPSSRDKPLPILPHGVVERHSIDGSSLKHSAKFGPRLPVAPRDDNRFRDVPLNTPKQAELRKWRENGLRSKQVLWKGKWGVWTLVFMLFASITVAMYVLAFMGCQNDKMSSFYVMRLDSVPEPDSTSIGVQFGLWGICIGTESNPGCFRVHSDASANDESYREALGVSNLTDAEDIQRLYEQAIHIQAQNNKLSWSHSIAFAFFCLEVITYCAQLLTTKPRPIVRVPPIMFGFFAWLVALVVAIVSQAETAKAIENMKYDDATMARKGMGLTLVFAVVAGSALASATACYVLIIRMEDVWNYDQDARAAKREEMGLHGYLHDVNFNCIGKPLPGITEAAPWDNLDQFEGAPQQQQRNIAPQGSPDRGGPVDRLPDAGDRHGAWAGRRPLREDHDVFQLGEDSDIEDSSNITGQQFKRGNNNTRDLTAQRLGRPSSDGPSYIPNEDDEDLEPMSPQEEEGEVQVGESQDPDEETGYQNEYYSQNTEEEQEYIEPEYQREDAAEIQYQEEEYEEPNVQDEQTLDQDIGRQEYGQQENGQEEYNEQEYAQEEYGQQEYQEEYQNEEYSNQEDQYQNLEGQPEEGQPEEGQPDEYQTEEYQTEEYQTETYQSEEDQEEEYQDQEPQLEEQEGDDA